MCRTLHVSRTWLWPVKVKCLVRLSGEKLRACGLVKKSLRLIGEGGGSAVRVGLPWNSFWTPLLLHPGGLLHGACFVSPGPSAALWPRDYRNALGT